jgi:phosphohistidine swiveling domain-containing protein
LCRSMSAILFSEVESSGFLHVSKIGGKAANLIKITKSVTSVSLESVPQGIVIPTDTLIEFYQQLIDEEHTLATWIIEKLKPLDKETPIEVVRKVGETIRAKIESLSIQSEDYKDLLAQKLSKFVDSRDIHLAVRSSGIEEDTEDLSFAGQHDTYLNLTPKFDIVLTHIVKCWASLYSDRALVYRLSNFSKLTDVMVMGVVIQEMVSDISCSGIMFTADPISNDRNTISTDSSYGLGEAVVSGLVNPDNHKIDKKTMTISSKTIGKKLMSIRATKDGSTFEEPIAKELQNVPAITDQEILLIAFFGKKIEDFYGSEQDIEYSIDKKGKVFILQTRPITSLFPIPLPIKKNVKMSPKPQVYMSFGHVQVMTDPIKSLGCDVLKEMFSGAATLQTDDIRQIDQRIVVAAGHPYINLTEVWNSPIGKLASGNLSLIDNWIGKGIKNVIQRPDFVQNAPTLNYSHYFGFLMLVLTALWIFIKTFFTWNSKKIRDAFTAKREELKAKSTFALGPEFAKIIGFFIPYMVILMISLKLLTFVLGKETTDSLVANIKLNTTIMNDMLHEIAEYAHKEPKLIEFLKTLQFPMTTDELLVVAKSKGFIAFASKFDKFIDEFGCRGMSEIDITRDRYTENVEFAIFVILEHKSSKVTLKQETKIDTVINEMCKRDRWAWWNLMSCGVALLVKRLIIHRFCTLFVEIFEFREDPKHIMMVMNYNTKKLALDIGSKFFEDPHDVFYLTLEEITNLSTLEEVDKLVESRKKEWKKSLKFKNTPRVMTNSGEIVDHVVIREEMKNFPPGTMIGTGVSSGTIVGRANVILDPFKSSTQDGDIIVAKQIDPTFSALFNHCIGLVSEVGGLMTHGSVVAREMQIPCVVGIIDATTIIKHGDRIRVNGTLGTVEVVEKFGKE